MLSIIILTHNEERFLPGCLENVKDLADEIVVVDKNSNDKTLEIAQKYQARIVKFTGFAFDEWRNLGSYHASNPWILYLDPDERLSKDLIKQIRKVIADKSGKYDAYRIHRQNYWWGRKFTACGAGNDWVTRLFRRRALKKWFGIIHESPEVIGKTGKLSAPILHFTHRDLISGLKKSYQWTNMEAQLFVKAGHPKISWWRLIKVSLQAFIKKYFIERGFTHGTEGLIESVVQAFNRFMVYEQIWEMQQNPSLDEKYQILEKELKK